MSRSDKLYEIRTEENTKSIALALIAEIDVQVTGCLANHLSELVPRG